MKTILDLSNEDCDISKSVIARLKQYLHLGDEEDTSEVSINEGVELNLLDFLSCIEKEVASGERNIVFKMKDEFKFLLVRVQLIMNGTQCILLANDITQIKNHEIKA